MPVPATPSTAEAVNDAVKDKAVQDASATSADDAAAAYKKNVVRGVISNSLAILVLWGVSCISPFVVLPVLVAVGIQLAVFALHGLPYLSEKYYDLSGSATHFVVVAVSVARCPGGASAQQVIFGLLSTVWMVRLGTFLYLRILRDGRDPRFDEMKKVPLRFLGAWMLQACWVVLVQIPVILVSSIEDTTPVAAYGVNAALLAGWLCAFLLESMADVQKFEFRQNPDNRHRFITTGLWRLARHPNYAGEIAMWTAAAAAVSVVGIFTANPTMHFAWLSPIFTTVLLLKVSGVPMVTAAGEKKWGSDPEYQEYMQTTPLLIPWPLAKGVTKQPAVQGEALL